MSIGMLKSSDIFLIGFFLLVISGGIILFIYLKNNQLALRAKQEKEIFQLARHKNGKLSISDVVTGTTMNSEEAESVLKEMAEKGYAGLVVTDSGLVLYEFYSIGQQNEPANPSETAPSNQIVTSSDYREKTGLKEFDITQTTSTDKTGSKRVWLIKGARLYQNSNGNTIGSRFPVGTAFEYVERDPKGWFRVKTGDNDEKWLSPRDISTTDPRHFFRITSSGLTGYLTEIYSDMSGGDLAYFRLADHILGEIRVETATIKSISISSGDENRPKIIVKTFSGNSYSGTFSTSPDLFLICEETMIRLNDVREAELVSLQNE